MTGGPPWTVHDGQNPANSIRPVPKLLTENALRYGEKLAFTDDRRSMTWAELERRTARLAAGFEVEPGARVAFCLANGVELVEGLLATVRAAAVGVPLDVRATDAELTTLLADCDPALVVTDHHHLPRITRLAAGRWRVAVAGEGTAEPRDDLGLDEPAWLLYTSGTTGTPRAAVFSQRSALWSAFASYQPLWGLSSTDRLLWPLPLAHTYAHSLCVLGTTVAGASARITSDTAGLARLMGEYGPTVLAGVPLTYQQLLDAGVGEVSSLRLCVTAGAPCDPDLRERVEQRLGAPLLDGYGSTETCGKITMEPLGAPRVRGSSGPPIPGMEVQLVDDEIWVRGPGVMLGYHNHPEVPHDGWYRTGDLGRFGEHGCLTVTGRLTDRIIRGGENVDPVEVEQVLRALPEVLDAAVVARTHPLLGEVPVAFVVPATEDLAPAGLLRSCAEVLSSHKVPDEILLTPAVPRTAAGKPKRAVLREALAERTADPELARLADRTPAERRSALIDLVCTETTAVHGDPTDPDKPFGLDSMAAMTLWHRLSTRTGLRLPATLVWDHPTPAALATYLNTQLPATPNTKIPPASPSERDFRGPGGPPVSMLSAGTDSSGSSGGISGEVHPASPSERDFRAPGGPLISTLPQATDNAATDAAATDHAVAIVAVACRYPGGVASPEDLWRVVVDGVDATGEFPADRGWDLASLYDPDPDHLGTTYTRRGGFLRDVADFDPLFFGISPREALATDPQQRLLLEVTWEVLERAGIPAPSVRGTKTGVFVGLMHAGYGSGVSPHELESHVGIGSAGSVASGRISYVFGLRGPTMTVDTACSSSLVAIDLAASALRAGECTLALAGGVTVMSSPTPFIAFSRQRGLSPDGRCRSFAAGADGTAWAEGVGLVLLEKLSDARRNGHPVLAVLRGSSVNSDGTSNGLTAPNGEAQRELIRLALADAGLRPSDVDVVEGHGTGTALGDPIEAGALLATYGQDRDGGEPLWLGSVKSNLGHTQAAAGVAGIVKMIEAMRHDVLPRSLYAEQPSPHVDWTVGSVRLLDEARPWPRNDRPRRAAISSFGIGGTNAHVIIEEPPAHDAGPSPRRWSVAPWLVSGSDEAGLRANADRLAAAVAGQDPVDVAYSLATTRTPLSHRAAVVASDADGLRTGLRQLAGGDPGLLRGSARKNPKVAFLCPGQGAQRPGMGCALTFPVFESTFAEVCEEFTPWLGRPLPLDDPELLDRTEYAQPALFALAVAMHAVLVDCGVRPDYLVGHSVGELAAAHLAGVFSRADAVRLVAARGRLMAALPPGGAMVAVRASLAEVSSLLPDGVAVAAVNGPRSVVLSGDEDEVSTVVTSLRRQATRLRVSHAFHSPLVEPVLAEFRAVAESVTYQRPAVPVVSTVTGQPELDLSADHWVRQARDTVRFADAVGWLADAGVTAFVEASPTPALSVLAEDCVPADSVCTSCGDTSGVLASLAALHVHGVPVDWQQVYAGSGARRCSLPTYPFQRQRYWLDAARHRARTGHPLLGEPMPDADGPTVRHTGVLSTDRQPWLADHVIGDRVLVPATVFAELTFRAAGPVRLAELTFLEPLALSEPVDVQVVTTDDSVTIWARATGRGPWTRHATATVAPATPPPTGASAAWPPAGAEEVTVDYPRLAARGQRYGPAFRAVTALWRRGTDLFAELALTPGDAVTAGSYTLHPALLDAALHVALLADGPGEPRVPLAFTGVSVHRTGAAAARAHVVRLGTDEVRVTLTDLAGQPLATVDSLVTRPAPNGSLHRLTWQPAHPTVDTVSEYELLDVAGLGADLPADDVPGRVHGLVTATLARVRDWVTGSRPGLLVVRTLNATGDDPDLAEAAVAGFVRSAQSEHPGRIVLVDGPTTELAAALRTGEPQVAVRAGVVMVPRLSLADQPTAAPPAIDPQGTVLVTGGTGALGASLVRYLMAEHGVRHLVLANRSGKTPEWATGLRVVACDVSDHNAVEALVADCQPPLTAVFHLAGVVADGVVDGMTARQVAAVLAPKAAGAWHLHEATKDRDLSAFVLYSSAAGVLGRPGQSNYAAANGFLDALARHRVTHGLPAQALAWGPWSTVDGAGMADRVATSEVPVVTEQEGIGLLDLALRSREPVLVPLPLDRTVREDRPAPAVTPAVGDWRDRLAAVPAQERETLLTELIRAELAAVLGFPDAAAFPADRPLTEVGLDSLTGLQVRNRLSAFTRVRLASTVVLDHPTLPALVTHVLEALDMPEPETGHDHRFSAVYQRVLRAQGPFEAMALRYFASYALPTFPVADRARHTEEPVRLAGGDGTPLVYFPGYLTQYDRVPTGLARAFDGERDLFLLEHPGFGAGRALPDSVATLVRTHVDRVRAMAAGRPVVLVGYCAGGVIAHMVARELGAAGVILLDTHTGVLRRDDPRGLELMAAGADLPDDVVEGFDDSSLIVGGGYVRLLESWRPEPSPVPTLLVRGRPTERMRRLDPDGDWQPHWPLPHDVADVTGDHYSLVRQDADTTAAAIRTWLQNRRSV